MNSYSSHIVSNVSIFIKRENSLLLMFSRSFKWTAQHRQQRSAAADAVHNKFTPVVLHKNQKFSSKLMDCNIDVLFVRTRLKNLFDYGPSTALHRNVQRRSMVSDVNKKNCEGEDKKEKGFFDNLIKKKILTIPNVLTASRMALAPILGYLVVEQSFTAALSIFVFAGFTDLLDGLIARNFKSQTSLLGSFMDPVADKLLVSILFGTLTYMNLIPLPLMSLVISRDVLLMSAGSYVRYTTLDPRPKSLKEFFDPAKHTVKLQPTTISKVNTAVQLSLVAATLAAPVFGFIDHSALQCLWYLTAATTIASGVGYIFAKDTIKYVGSVEKLKKKLGSSNKT